MARKVTLRELQQLVGHLNFASKAVVPGRAFLHQLCDEMSGARQPQHRVHIKHNMVMKASGFYQLSSCSTIVSLKGKGLAAWFIRGHMSVLTFVSKALGYQEVTGDFCIRKMLAGWGRDSCPTRDERQPISPAVL